MTNFQNDFWSDEFLEKLNVRLRPYEYQRELVQHAIQSTNTIICLQPASGKTFVLALLLKYYSLRKNEILFENQRKFLAFVCVSRSILLKQQVERLNNVKHLRITSVEENVDLIELTKTNDVIVCTPQKLLK